MLSRTTPWTDRIPSRASAWKPTQPPVACGALGHGHVLRELMGLLQVLDLAHMPIQSINPLKNACGWDKEACTLVSHPRCHPHRVVVDLD